LLTSARKRELRARAHHLKPVVIVGQRGVTDAVIAAVEQALYDHELVKIRLRALASELRRGVIDDLCDRLGADLVGLIGAVATLYKPKPDERADGELAPPARLRPSR
jgi:RNA-binding protein